MIPIQDTIPRRTTPFVTWALIAINTVVFLLEASLDPATLERVIFYLGVVPARYTDPHWPEAAVSYWPFLTNMFLHGGWMHLIGNMWTLWIFGDNVEDRLGHGRYLLFYILSGICASLTHVLFNMGSQIPAIGASGAIAGVMGAYFVLFPHSRVVTLVPVFFLPFFFEIPAVFYLGIWFMTQLFSGTFAIIAPALGGGIAWWAHIGGFVAGIVLLKFLQRYPRRYYRRHYPDEWVWVRDLYRY
ncbi:MAG: rhomboid family intramembrane serine protease [Calditrichaeota bacterium]|nr:MAG: rhomboid family intramembrane serine protease [Calditrichota bacterium]